MKRREALNFALATMVAAISTAATRSAPPVDERTLTLPATPFRYANPKLPADFEERWVKALDTTPQDNVTTDAGATLGRVLFYDTRLSLKNRVSCGSCHIQKHAFAEPRAVSIGHEGRKGDRNTMSLVNLRFGRAGFFWDERAHTLEDAVALPFRSQLEMGAAGPGAVRAIAADARYAPLFKAAFGTATVDELHIRRALAQFIRALLSCDSKYDRGAEKAESVKADFATFTPLENQGKKLFLQHCNLCHHVGEGKHVAFFDMFRSLNNGLDPDATALDGGRGDITLNPSEVGQFRASSLRNVEVTGPYMHDGRLETLEQVIEHYSSGVYRHPNAGAVGRFAFGPVEKSALVAFLKTLTDSSFLADPKFSDPWSGSPGTAPFTAHAAPAPTKVAERAAPFVDQRLKTGQGIPVGESLPWLRSLDRNGDAELDSSEIAPLIDILVKTRVATLTTARVARGRGASAAKPQVPKKGDSLGDFNGDGVVDETEARALAAFKRLVELGDGGALRRAVRTDRFLGGYQLGVAEAEAARVALNSGRLKLAEQEHAQDLELLRAFEQKAGKQAVARFQTIVIDRQVGAVRRRTSRDENPRPAIVKQVAEFDKDGNGKWTSTELIPLAQALDRLAGGFGQAAPQVIDMAQFTRRLKDYSPEGKTPVTIVKLPERLVEYAIRGDRNHDMLLSGEELEDYVRTTAFGHLLEEGIYIGGGFANCLQQYADAIEELGLAPKINDEVERLFEAHAQRLEEMTELAMREIFLAFRDAVGKKAPPAAIH
jgi:cytochrome c peroxidase